MLMPSEILRKILMALSVVTLAFVAGQSVGNPLSVLFVIVLLLVMYFISLSKLDVINMLCVYFASDVLVHYFKRLIFVFVPSMPIYYGILSVPSLILVMTLLAWLAKQNNRRIPRGGVLLAVFVFLSVILTWLSYGAENQVPFVFKLNTTNQLCTAVLFFLGATLSFKAVKKIGVVVAWLVVISAGYGLWHLLFGPTAAEKIWANYMAGRSVLATSVWLHVNYGYQTFRPMSVFADAFSWGVFLNGALVLFFFLRVPNQNAGNVWGKVVLLSMFVSLFLTLSRSPWSGFLSTICFYYALRKGYLSSPRVLMTFLLFLLVGALIIFAHLPEDYIVKLDSDAGAVAERYVTSGTLRDRVVDWEMIHEALEKHWLIGRGLARNELAADLQESALDKARMHVSFMSLLAGTGIAGTLLFVGFFYSCISSIFRRIRLAGDEAVRSSLYWVVAFACGHIVMSFTVGPLFLNNYFFFILGLGVGSVRIHSETTSTGKMP